MSPAREHDRSKQDPGPGAPEAALLSRPWPRWRKVMAYAVLAALALVAVHLVDRRVDELAEESPTTASEASEGG